MIADPQPTSLYHALLAELNDYQRRRSKAAEQLAEDDCEYRRKVLAIWDYDIDVKLKQIAREEQKAMTP